MKLISRIGLFIFLLVGNCLLSSSSSISYIGDSTNKGIIAAKNFVFSQLLRQSSDPDEYTLALLDAGLIPDSYGTATLGKEHAAFKPVQNWMNPGIFESESTDVSIEEIRDKGILCYLVCLKNKKHPTAAERLTSRLSGKSQRTARSLIYDSSMIILPLEKQGSRALAYLLGLWKGLVNNHTIVPDWGLRLASSIRIFSERTVKFLKSKSITSANPTKRLDTKEQLDDIDSFGLVVGIDGLESVGILPLYCLGSSFKRIIEAADTFKFHMPAADEEGEGDTLTALMRMALYLYDVHKNGADIHPKMRAFLDEELHDAALIDALTKKLESILSKKTESSFRVFPADTVWQRYGPGAVFRYRGRPGNKDLMAVLSGNEPTLDSKIEVSRKGKQEYSTERLGRCIYTLPLEHESKFYRFEKGRWFEVAVSRFGSIAQALRKIKVDIPALIPYTVDHAQGTPGKKDGLYQEDRYNRAVVDAWNGKNAGSGSGALLIDRLNIYLSRTKEDKFEFGDILLYDNKGNIQIIHLKRKESGDIDHHRAQVERCADYLATELNKKTAGKLLFLSCVRGFCRKNGGLQPTESTLGKRKRLPTKKASETWDTYVRTSVLRDDPIQNSEVLGRLNTHLRKMDLSFFEGHEDMFDEVLDALKECTKKKELQEFEVENFVVAVKQVIELERVLFSRLVIKKSDRKRIKIIMAVIDDRAVVKKVRGNDGDRSNETELFRKQVLWGLDRTSLAVQNLGFDFKLAVVNENTTRRDWDAFGAILPHEFVSLHRSVGVSATDDATPDRELPDSFDDEVFTNEDKVARYEYNSVDINGLLHDTLLVREGVEDYDRFSLSDVPADENDSTNGFVHRNGNLYVLPPIIGHKDGHVLDTPEETLLKVLGTFSQVLGERNFPAAKELIIPFNPGGHWLVIRVELSDSELNPIAITCIESLRSAPERDFPLLRDWLEEIYGCETALRSTIRPCIQSDGVSCGAITVENVKQLFERKRLKNRGTLSEAQLLALKLTHQTYLKGLGIDFDF